MKFEIYTVDRTASDYLNERIDIDNGKRVLSVEKVEWNYFEPDFAKFNGSRKIDIGTEIAIKAYDKDGADLGVVFVGKVFKRNIKGGMFVYEAYGYEMELVSMEKTVNYNDTIANILVDLFSRVGGGKIFKVTVEDNTYSQKVVKIRGNYKLWDLITNLVNALGWVMQISHDLELDSSDNMWKTVVNIHSYSGTPEGDLVSSYYGKMYGDGSYRGVVSGFNKDTSKLINKFYYALAPKFVDYVEVIYDINSYDDTYDYVVVDYRISTISKVWYSTDNGSSWTEYDSSEYYVGDDGYTLYVMKKSENAIKVEYKYKFVRWNYVADNTSISKYGERSKKILVDWTNDVDVAKDYALNLLEYYAIPIVKGKFKFKNAYGFYDDSGNSVDVGDVYNLYHDEEGVAYEVFIKSIELPIGMVGFESVDLKYRMWEVDVDKRIKMVEKSSIGEETEKGLVETYSAENQISIDLEHVDGWSVEYYSDSGYISGRGDYKDVKLYGAGKYDCNNGSCTPIESPFADVSDCQVSWIMVDENANLHTHSTSVTSDSYDYIGIKSYDCGGEGTKTYTEMVFGNNLSSFSTGEMTVWVDVNELYNKYGDGIYKVGIAKIVDINSGNYVEKAFVIQFITSGPEHYLHVAVIDSSQFTDIYCEEPTSSMSPDVSVTVTDSFSPSTDYFVAFRINGDGSHVYVGIVYKDSGGNYNTTLSDSVLSSGGWQVDYYEYIFNASTTDCNAEVYTKSIRTHYGKKITDTDIFTTRLVADMNGERLYGVVNGGDKKKTWVCRYNNLGWG